MRQEQEPMVQRRMQPGTIAEGASVGALDPDPTPLSLHWESARKASFHFPSHVSPSLASALAHRRSGDGLTAFSSPAALAAGFTDHEGGELLSVLVEADDAKHIGERIGNTPGTQEVQELGGGFLAARLPPETAERLIQSPGVRQVEIPKENLPHLTRVLPDIGLTPAAGGKRLVPEDGSGVLIGIVDSGFDLSHPIFRDSSGKLRVEALLDQRQGNRELNAEELEREWAKGTGPGADPDGHGTHVACIAAGSPFQGGEGVAPGARLLLVKTDYLRTQEAVSWIFRRAADRPCAVNLSYGRHWGAHDGTDIEERLHRTLTGPGRIIVASAGNERESNLHIGGWFYRGQTQEVTFDLLRQPKGRAFAVLNLYYDRQDDFDVAVLDPAGSLMEAPALGDSGVERVVFASSLVTVEISRRFYAWSDSIEVEVQIALQGTAFQIRDLQNWKIRLRSRELTFGRIDGWFHNDGFAMFRDHPLLDRLSTIGIPATGGACLTVASHVSSSTWQAEEGDEEDTHAVPGRCSPFSSQGPTRDGRWKPDISAPGQYVTAALADHSEKSKLRERTLSGSRVVTLEGTSMAAPVVTGIVALMLQKRPALEVEQASSILAAAARHDRHTGLAPWGPAYGFGKVHLAAVLDKL